ncbi:uncharacterized protein LOC106757460 isoform X3 [Vigna radiata var. radiata]|uniref:Uncharacterized protein LOC106757460 isoform X3 n=1 Tax=Vigna radiata var. radiata TaxID=3916 RepID=A0A3Q0EXD4_VIGRR|nr:uncharacterized protein LOC106757460 isoform X3 [Vigna radiata var. radiata]
MANSEPKTDYAEIYTALDALDASSVFHTFYDVVGFVLYMHQQIPSTVQDMAIEFEAMHSEYKELETELGTEVKPSFRRKHVSKMRDIKGADDFARSKAAESLSRKAIRTLISKGAGSVTYPGPIRLFVLIKAPSSFNQPLHFLPKRDFRYNRKVVPLGLLFKCRNQNQEMVATASEDLIWFQCRHVIKGLAMNTLPEE